MTTVVDVALMSYYIILSNYTEHFQDQDLGVVKG